MSSTTAVGAAAGTESVVDLRGLWIGLATLNIFYLIVRIYEQIFGWRAGLDSFAPGKQLTVVLNHADGSKHEIKVNHTYNAGQIGWFKAGSALNLIKLQNQ